MFLTTYFNAFQFSQKVLHAGIFASSLQRHQKKLRHVFPCEFCKIFKNSYCTEHLRATALLLSTQIMRESGTKWVNSLQSSVAFHLETSHLICFIWLIKISSTCNLKGKHLLSQSISGEKIPQVKNYMFRANTRNQRPI